MCHRLFHAKVVKELGSCLESVNLDYFIPDQPHIQTDQKTLFQNSSGVAYANTDYSETAIGEIVKNNQIQPNLFVVGKLIPYMGYTDPYDLSCWSEDVPYIPGLTNQTVAGFTTWPFVKFGQEITAIDWAKSIKNCGEPATEEPITEEPITEIPDVTTSSSQTTVTFCIFMIFMFGFIQ